MVLGRLTHYGLDALGVSIILGGIQMNNGFRLSPKALGVPETGPARQALDSYLGLGEGVFAYLCGATYGSSYFRRGETPKP